MNIMFRGYEYTANVFAIQKAGYTVRVQSENELTEEELKDVIKNGEANGAFVDDIFGEQLYDVVELKEVNIESVEED